MAHDASLTHTHFVVLGGWDFFWNKPIVPETTPQVQRAPLRRTRDLTCFIMPEALEKKFEAAVDVSDANDALPAAPTMIEGMDEEACNLLWWLEGGKDNQYKWWCDKGERWREERINFWWVDKSLDAHKISVLHTHIFNKPLSHLGKLNLSGCAAARGENGDNLALAMLVAALSSACLPDMSHLYFARNKLTDSDGQILVKALASSLPEKLEALTIDNNTLGDGTAKLLSEGSLKKLGWLVIHSNSITDQGALAIANGQWPSLHKLHMQNNLFEDEVLAIATHPPAAALHSSNSTAALQQHTAALTPSLCVCAGGGGVVGVARDQREAIVHHPGRHSRFV